MEGASRKGMDFEVTEREVEVEVEAGARCGRGAKGRVKRMD